MFVVTIEQEIDDDFFGHWEQRAAYLLEGQDVGQALYQALYRWIKTYYQGSTYHCLQKMGIDDRTLRVTVSYGSPSDQLREVYQSWFVPLDKWQHNRHTSTSPVHCAICDWYGPMKRMTHGYTLNSQYEIEPLDRCPQCRAVLT